MPQKYTRPNITYTDTIQNIDKIKNLVKDYNRVESIDEVPLGTFVKYLTLRDSKQRFCIGGRLYKKHKDYVILAGVNNSRFSVQRYHWDKNADKKKDQPIFITIFWKSQFDCNTVNVKKLKQTIKELHQSNEQLIEDNEKLKKTIITLSKQIKENKNVKKENIILKKQLSQIQTDHPEMFS
jgi:cell division protein FtsB